MRVAAVCLALIAFGVPTADAAIYDFTVELPASPGAGGRGEAPQQRLSFSLDTAQAQVLAPSPGSTAAPMTQFSPAPLSVFTYGTNTTTITSSVLTASSLILNIYDPSLSNEYVLRSGSFSFPSMTALSNGTGTSITFPTGISLPVTNVSNELYLRQDGTLFVTVEPATTVPEPAGWIVLVGALGLLGISSLRYC